LTSLPTGMSIGVYTAIGWTRLARQAWPANTRSWRRGVTGMRRLKRASGRAAVVAAILGLGALPTPLSAQWRAGVTGAWAEEADFGYGVRMHRGLGTAFGPSRIEAAISFDRFLPQNDSLSIELGYWELNANAIQPLSGPDQRLRLYAGTGISYSRETSNGRDTMGRLIENSDSEWRLNLLGGVRLRVAGILHPFIEGRLQVGGWRQLILAAGVLVGPR